jgi:hypothetical protein
VRKRCSAAFITSLWLTISNSSDALKVGAWPIDYRTKRSRTQRLSFSDFHGRSHVSKKWPTSSRKFKTENSNTANNYFPFHTVNVNVGFFNVSFFKIQETIFCCPFHNPRFRFLTFVPWNLAPNLIPSLILYDTMIVPKYWPTCYLFVKMGGV